MRDVLSNAMWAVALIVVALPMTYLVVNAPALALVLAASPMGLVLLNKIGLPAMLIVGSLVAMTFSAFLGRYAAAANGLTAIGGVIIVTVGLIMLPRLHLPPLARAAGIAYLAIATLQTIPSAVISVQYGFRGWIALVLAPMTVSAVAGVLRPGVINEEQRIAARTWILGAIVLAAVANIAVGLKQALLGLSPVEEQAAKTAQSTYKVGEFIRLMGTFQTNQDFGLLVACLIPAVLMVAIASTGRQKRWLLALTVGLLFVTFLSLTRTALVAAAVVSVAGLVIWGKGGIPGRVVRMVSGVAVALGSVYLLGSLFNSPRITGAVERVLTFLDLSEDTSFNARSSYVLPRALNAFSEHLFLGYGSGSAGPVSQKYASDAPIGGFTTDNGYLMIGIQLGLVGLIAFVVMLVSIAWYLLKSPAPFAHAGSATIGALLVAMMLAQYWSLLAPIAVVAAVVGAGLASAAPPVVRTAAHPRRGKARRAAAL